MTNLFDIFLYFSEFYFVTEKNTKISMSEELQVQEGFNVIKLENVDKDILNFSKEVDSTFIQLHFCLSESGKLHFGPHYVIEVKSENSLLLYNPNQKLPINLSLQPKTKYVIFIVSIKVFHSFFSQVAEIIPFLDEENKDKIVNVQSFKWCMNWKAGDEKL